MLIENMRFFMASEIPESSETDLRTFFVANADRFLLDGTAGSKDAQMLSMVALAIGPGRGRRRGHQATQCLRNQVWFPDTVFHFAAGNNGILGFVYLHVLPAHGPIGHYVGLQLYVMGQTDRQAAQLQ